MFLWFFASSAGAFGQTTTVQSATSGEIKAFFQSTKKTVLTFVGYSGAGYEDEASMLKQAERIPSEFDPKRTIRHRVGAGEAMQRRTIAVRLLRVLCGRCDVGGFLKGTERLSPTSEAMVENSNIVIGIGGGEVSRDELVAARRSGKKVRFIPADINHQKARETARKKRLPAPTDFHGAAHAVLEAEKTGQGR